MRCSDLRAVGVLGLVVILLGTSGCKIFGMDCGGQVGVGHDSGGTTANGGINCTGHEPLNVVQRPSTALAEPAVAEQAASEDFAAFRITSISIRDPHILTQQSGVCLDVTGLLNNDLNQRLSGDEDQNGRVDAGAMLIFRNLTVGGSSSSFQLISASCDTLPNGSCVPDDAVNSEINALYTYSQNGANPCLAPVAAHLKPYFPGVTAPAQPCFATSSFDLDVTFGSARFPMLASRLGGTFVGNPPTQIINGLMRAFLPESAANAAVLPASIPAVGGKVLSEILPGGTNNCAAWNDRDLGPDGVTHGWWFYANYTAERVNASLVAVPVAVRPATLRLWAFPNPFRPHVNLSFSAAQSAHATVEIVDPGGRRVATLLDGTVAAGWHQLPWDGRDEHGARASAGTYFAKIRVGDAIGSRPIVLLR